MDLGQARSRITNGAAKGLVVLPTADGRTQWVRRLRDVVSLHISDLGGESRISEAQRSIVRRAGTLTVELERMEQRFASAGGCSDMESLDQYQRTSNTLRRLLESVGIQQKQRSRRGSYGPRFKKEERAILKAVHEMGLITPEELE